MASFLYFLPRAQTASLVRDGRLNHDELRRWGLGDVLADCVDVPNHVAITAMEGGGPENLAGIVLCVHPGNPAGKIPRLPIHDPGSQRWLKIGLNDTTPWIGWECASLPQSEDLERREAISGYRRVDAFGRSWRMPVIRGLERQYGYLPVDYSWTPDNGSRPGLVLRQQFQQLWNDSAKIWDHIYVEGFNCPETFVAVFVARCFAINYRIGPRELEALRMMGQPLFDGGDVNEWAGIACDIPALIEYARQKKMTVFQAARDGTHFTTGDPAGTVDLTRAAPNSE